MWNNPPKPRTIKTLVAANERIMADRGRPTDYNDEIQAKADAYVDGEYMSQGDIVPSQEGLAEYLGKARSTVIAWAKDGEHPQFSYTFDRLAAKQARLIINGGLSSEMNSTIAKLMLHNHGYSDRTESRNDHTSSDGSMKPQQIILTAPENANDKP